MGEVIICEPSKTCADPNINRWHCMRGHDGADPGVCPLTVCDRRGANPPPVSHGADEVSA